MKELTTDDIEICMTEDNSSTIIHKDLQVSYRSIHGAKTESDWVFIQNSKIFDTFASQPVCKRVVELGFGMGSNFRSCAEKAMELNIPLHYISIEHQPIPPSIITENDMVATMIRTVLEQARNKQTISRIEYQNTTLELHCRDIFDPELDIPHQADAFFHDPFGPLANPQAWTPECFAIIATLCAPTAILSTYGAAGHARRAMAQAGFYVASVPGLGKKREITIASKSSERITHGKLCTKYLPLRPSNT
jgi:tRNA U34 5-methylaminomethyl-2-thiouridine-forming methyltransferase MnmC